MKPNVGGRDRLARLVGGVLLVVAAGLVEVGLGPLSAVGVGLTALLVGAELLATAAVRRCPVNAAAGIDTTDE